MGVFPASRNRRATNGGFVAAASFFSLAARLHYTGDIPQERKKIAGFAAMSLFR